jgi:hypothetical protein
MVTGKPLLTGEALATDEPQMIKSKYTTPLLRVWYWNGEDPMEELQRRIAATYKYYMWNGSLWRISTL